VQVAVWAFLAAGFTAGLVTLARHANLRWRVALPLMIFVVALLGSGSWEFIDLRALALAWLLLVIGLYVDHRPLAWTKLLLVITLALASQMKFTVAVMAVGVVLALTIHAGRKIPWLATVYTAAYLFFWLLAGQQLSSWPAYLDHSLHIANAYVDIESTFPPGEATSISLFLVGAGAILALLLATSWKQWRLVAASVLATLFGLFLLFKSGFVRDGDHGLEATGGLAMVSVLIGLAIWNRHGWKSKCLIGSVLLFNFGLLWHSDVVCGIGGLPVNLAAAFQSVPANTNTALAWLEGDASQLSSHDNLDRLRRVELPDIHGSVDIYSWGQDLLLAHGLDYRPRPVFQSYLAESPFLAELNARHLRGPEAPESILFNIGAIDQQFPALADATSWPEILSRYQLADASKPWLLYRHADAGALFTITRGPVIVGKLGQPITLPANDSLIWARINLHLTGLGKINRLLFKSPKLSLLVVTDDGQASQYRFIPTIPRQGFLLSPLVEDRITFALLQSSSWQSELANLKVKSITVVCDQAGMPQCYDDEFECSFDRLSIPTRDISQVLGIRRYRDLRKFIAGMKANWDWFGPAQAELCDGSYALATFGHTSLRMEHLGNASAATVGYGIVDANFD